VEILRFSGTRSLLKPFSNTNILMIILVTALCCTGLLALYSASLHIDLPLFKRVVGKQFIWIMMGGTLATIVFFIQRKVFFDTAYFLYLFGIVLILLPFILGKSPTGTCRWISIGTFHFQPSEFMKVFVILAIAKYLSSADISVSDFRALIVPVLFSLVPMLIILKQPDLGTSMIFFILVFPLLFWAGARMFHIFVILSPIISILTAFNFYTFFIWVVLLILVLYLSKEKLWVSIVLLIFNLSLGFATPVLWNKLRSYQQNRILTLFNVNADPLGAGYQIIQSKIAIGSGGLFGKGLGQGTQTHLKFLPEQHSDFIFSVIGEECGFAGVMFVLTLFFVMIMVLLTSKYRLRDRFSSLVIIGIGSTLLLHVVINIAMTIGLMPVTRLPLPFLSYGGSFIITCFIFVGLVLNINAEKPG